MMNDHFKAMAISVLFTAFCLAGCQEDKVAAADALPRVSTSRVEYRTEVIVRQLSGQIMPKVENVQSFRVGGKVLARYVNVGDVVAANAELAALDRTDIQLKVNEALAEVEAALSVNKQASEQLIRTSTLLEKGLVARAIHDQATTAAEEARGRLSRGKLTLELARNALRYSSLTAEYAGVVTATMVESGQVIAMGEPAVRIAQTDLKEALVAVPETDLQLVKNSVAEVSTWADPQNKMQATLRELSPIADERGRTFNARFSLEKVAPEVALGMSATLHLTTRGEKKLACIPMTSIFQDGTGVSVFLVDAEGGLQRRMVVIDHYKVDTACISDGVSEGSVIASSGVQKLEDGMKISPLPLVGG